MKVIDCVQGTEAWHLARSGKVTSSCISDVLSKIKRGEAAGRRDYKAQKVAEILTGYPQDNGYINDEMRWGLEYEPLARAAYEVSRGVMVDQMGFVLHPSIDRAGASPDGIVAGGGMVEIKCPKTATHLQYLFSSTVPAKYEPQMAWQMACTGEPWNDFVSYDPRLPEELQLFVARLPRNQARIDELEAEVRLFLAEVDEMLAKLAHVAARRMK